VRGVGTVEVWATVAQQGAGTSLVSMAAVGGRGSARLDGFKVRALAAAGAAEGRRWHYELEWSCMLDATPTGSSRLEVLVLGTGRGTGTGEAVARGDDVSRGMLAGGRWDGVVLVASPWHGAGPRVCELQVVDIALHVLQSQAALAAMPPVWLCTGGVQAVGGASAHHAHAGLWGLARTCRQECVSLPAWCVDVRGGVRGMASVIAQRAVQLACGGVRGLQTRTSVEPEVARGEGTLHVPRLVAPYDAQPTVLDVAFDGLSQLLDAHTLRAMAALDMAAPVLAYTMLGTLCEQHVSRSRCHTRTRATTAVIRS
jgi:hypothetical protein